MKLLLLSALVLLLLFRESPVEPHEVGQSSSHDNQTNFPKDVAPHTVINVHQSEPLQSQAPKEQTKHDHDYTAYGLILNLVLVLVTGGLAYYAGGTG